MEYNSERKTMIIPEYGRSVQKMVEYAITIEDRSKRNEAAREIIRQMSFLQQSNIKDAQELDRKLWDHLIIIADYKLDIDSPYPIPDPAHFAAPKKIKYNCETKDIPYRYYGSIVINMIDKAVILDDGEEKSALVRDIANNMKKLYLAWNKGSVDDGVILNHLSELSGGRLEIKESLSLSSNFNIPNPNQNAESRTFKKKKKDFKQNYSNGAKKFYKKK